MARVNPLLPRECAAANSKPPIAELPAYVPFPVTALPRPLAVFVAEAAAALGCDSSMVALPTIAVAGSLIGNTRAIRLKNSWREPCIFWTCVIADSGTLKSPAHDVAVRPLHRLQKRLTTEYTDRLGEYETAIGGGASDLPNWLEFHRAGPVTIDRKTSEKKTLFIDRAAVSHRAGQVVRWRSGTHLLYVRRKRSGTADAPSCGVDTCARRRNDRSGSAWQPSSAISRRGGRAKDP